MLPHRRGPWRLVLVLFKFVIPGALMGWQSNKGSAVQNKGETSTGCCQPTLLQVLSECGVAIPDALFLSIGGWEPELQEASSQPARRRQQRAMAHLQMHKPQGAHHPTSEDGSQGAGLRDCPHHKPAMHSLLPAACCHSF